MFDMGEPVKIVNLAEELIKLLGMQPHKDIEIVYTGLRPGEKLYEELLLSEESHLPTHHEKIFVARSMDVEFGPLKLKLDSLIKSAIKLDLVALRRDLQEIVPEYTPANNKPKAEVIQLPSSVVHQ